MYSALTYGKPLAGIVALSSWLPLHSVLQEVMFHELLEESLYRIQLIGCLMNFVADILLL